MPTLIMTKGLPGCGKSTWACALVRADGPTHTVRITKDLLRQMLHDNMHASGTEALVLRARDSLVRSFLMSGVNVIVDDTNLAPYHETSLRSIAEACGAAFRVQDFTDIDVEECIRRDARRTATVGPDVIREMHHTHLAT